MQESEIITTIEQYIEKYPDIRRETVLDCGPTSKKVTMTDYYLFQRYQNIERGWKTLQPSEAGNTIGDVLINSFTSPRLGKGDDSEVFKFKDKEFYKHLLKKDGADPRYNGEVGYFPAPNLDIVFYKNWTGGRNLGQDVLGFPNSFPGFKAIVNSGTCLNKIYNDYRKNYETLGFVPQEAAKLSYHKLLDRIVSMPESSYEKMADDLAFSTSKGRYLDAGGENICIDGDLINFIDLMKDKNYLRTKKDAPLSLKSSSASTVIAMLTKFNTDNENVKSIINKNIMGEEHNDAFRIILNPYKQYQSEIHSSKDALDKISIIEERVNSIFSKIKLKEGKFVPESFISNPIKLDHTMPAEALLEELHKYEVKNKLRTIIFPS